MNKNIIKYTRKELNTLKNEKKKVKVNPDPHEYNNISF